MASKMPAARDEDDDLISIALAEQGQFRNPLHHFADHSRRSFRGDGRIPRQGRDFLHHRSLIKDRHDVSMEIILRQTGHNREG